MKATFANGLFRKGTPLELVLLLLLFHGAIHPSQIDQDQASPPIGLIFLVLKLCAKVPTDRQAGTFSTFDF